MYEFQHGPLENRSQYLRVLLLLIAERFYLVYKEFELKMKRQWRSDKAFYYLKGSYEVESVRGKLCNPG